MAAPKVCPIMSNSTEAPSMCLEEDCAFFLKSYKACSLYVLAYNAALDIKSKQQ
jgi:hypothetical protein